MHHLGQDFEISLLIKIPTVGDFQATRVGFHLTVFGIFCPLVLPSLIDTDWEMLKTPVREQAQALLLKIMDQLLILSGERLGCSCKVCMGFREKIYGISSVPLSIGYLQRVYLE